jgi:hypothetical protein
MVAYFSKLFRLSAWGMGNLTSSLINLEFFFPQGGRIVSEIEHPGLMMLVVAALRENKGLVNLAVYFFAIDESDWTKLFESISLHPSLRSHQLVMYRTDIDAKKRREFTKAVAKMLSVNERVVVMSFDDDTFDKDD